MVPITRTDPTATIPPDGPAGPTTDDPGPALGLAPLSGHRFDIQVLRGVAVLLVVLYHAQVVTPGGFVGVDVFFVISGYVIGRRLVSRLAGTTRGVMGEFYLDRARRILPALSLLLVFVILTAPLLAPIGGAAQTSPTGIAASLFSANFYLYREAGGYFQAAAELNPLLHTWSLSVEEQFYFVIPALVLALWLFGRRNVGPVRAVRALVTLLVVVSFALCVALSTASGTVWRVDGLRFAFFSPFTRAWEFAVGLGVVLLPAALTPSGRLRTALLAVGALGIAVAAFTFTDTMVFPGYAALLPVLGAALVIHAGTRPPANPTDTTTSRSRRTALTPVGFLGDVSYSWYLWHWPLIVFTAAFWPSAGAFPLVVAAAVSLLPAWWSYRWIERRLRATPSSRPTPTVALALVCITAPIIAAGIAIPIRHAINDRTSTELGAVADVAANQPGERRCNSPVPYGARSGDGCTWGPPDASTSVVLIGDSNAGQLSNALIGASERDHARLEIATLGGCPFTDLDVVFAEGTDGDTTPADCRRFATESVDALVADPPDVVVLSTAVDMWIWYDLAHLVDPATGGVVTDHRAAAQLMEDSLARLMGRITAAGSAVVLVDIVPKPYAYDLRRCSSLAILVDSQRCLPEAFPVDAHLATRRANATLARAAARSGSTTWSFAEAICPDGSCRPIRDGNLVWRDPNHISAATSDTLVPTAAARLRETLAGSEAP